METSHLTKSASPVLEHTGFIRKLTQKGKTQFGMSETLGGLGFVYTHHGVLIERSIRTYDQSTDEDTQYCFFHGISLNPKYLHAYNFFEPFTVSNNYPL
jgi:hypothetical protein